jgi:acyl carrier protein
MEKTLTTVGVEVRRLVGMILRRPIGETENPSRRTEAAWDSLKHIEIAFLLEDRFGIRLTERDIATLEDIEQIVTLLEARTCDTTS